jgi:hypothetical protein
MSIRIDQSSDHSAQNPPPEDHGMVGEASATHTSFVDTGGMDAQSCVYRGNAAAAAAVDDLTFSVPEPSAAGASSASAVADSATTEEARGVYQPVGLRNLVEMPYLGWVLHDSGGKYSVGTGEERLVLKLPPRWQLSPTTPELNAKLGEVK